MKQLLKIYCKDFAINALYLFILVLVIGVILSLIMQGEENIATILYSLFVTFYWILFFYAYPLTQCLKWANFAPIQKWKLVSFNFVFQIYKLFIILIFFMILSLVLAQFGGSQNYQKLMRPGPVNVHKGLDQNLEAKSAQVYLDYILNLIQEKYPYNLESPFWSTFIVSAGLLMLVCFFCLIFNVSPRLIIENKGGITLYTKFKRYYFLIKKYRILVYSLIPLGFILKLTYYYWNSSFFVISFSMSFVIFFTIWTYSQKLIFDRFIHQMIIPSGFIFFLFVTTFFYQYSHYRLKSKDVGIPGLIEELGYLRNFGEHVESVRLAKMLEADLTGYDVKRLVSYVDKNNYPEGWRKVILESTNFEKIVTSKKSFSGIIQVLKFFMEDDQLKKTLSFSNIQIMLNHWEKLKLNKEKEFFKMGKNVENKIKIFESNSIQQNLFAQNYDQQLMDILRDFQFKKEEIEILFQSSSHVQHLLALKISQQHKIKNLEISRLIIDNVLKFNSQNLFLASQIMSQKLCRKVESLEMILQRNQWLNKSECEKEKVL
jgi:hypothetical protein